VVAAAFQVPPCAVHSLAEESDTLFAQPGAAPKLIPRTMIPTSILLWLTRSPLLKLVGLRDRDALVIARASTHRRSYSDRSGA